MVEERKVMDGYKKTEVGVIPEDWETVVIDEICYIRRGASPRPIESFVTDKSNGVNWIKIGDVNKYGKINKTAQKIIQEGEAKSVPVKIGDLLLSNSMSFGKPYILEIDGCIHDGWLAISEKEDIINKKYLFYYLMSQNAKDFFDKMSAGSGVKNLNKAIVSKLIVALPNKEEQKLISQALTEIDDLIDSIENLIEKKEKIKQGTMQELLTGEKRLDGFSGEWEVKNLGSICSITTGKLDANAMVENGDYRFYTCAKEAYRINNYAFDTEALLVSGNGANVGYIHYYKGKFNAYQRTYVLTDFLEEIKYIKVFMDTRLKDRIDSEVNAGNTPYIKMDTLTDMKINIPTKRAEQKAIAQIIFDMDQEIQGLEEKLEKYKTIKQAMMQELLTGRIRLI